MGEKVLSRLGIKGGVAYPLEAAEVDKKKEIILDTYARTGNKTTAAREAGVTRSTVNLWYKEDQAFRLAMDEAREEAIEALEQEARRRATGIAKPLHHQGHLTGDTVTEYSDILLIFLLKGLRPNVYRDNAKVEVEHRDAPDTVSARERLATRLEEILARRQLTAGAGNNDNVIDADAVENSEDSLRKTTES